jgi:hypothetical protein
VRGWKIAKDKGQHQVDIVVAMAMAAHAAVQESMEGPSLIRRQDIEREVDVDEKWFVAVTAVVVVDNRTGAIGVAYFGTANPALGLPPVTVIDFDEPQMTPTFFQDIAERLDAVAERCRSSRHGGPPAVWLLVPRWFEEQAGLAMLHVFARHAHRSEQRVIETLSLEERIDPVLLANGGQLQVMASLHFHARQVTFSAAARSRSATLPVGVTGAFNGTHDVVTSAILLGVISQFHEPPSRQPVWGMLRR